METRARGLNEAVRRVTVTGAEGSRLPQRGGGEEGERKKRPITWMKRCILTWRSQLEITNSSKEPNCSGGAVSQAVHCCPYTPPSPSSLPHRNRGPDNTHGRSRPQAMRRKGGGGTVVIEINIPSS